MRFSYTQKMSEKASTTINAKLLSSKGSTLSTNLAYAFPPLAAQYKKWILFPCIWECSSHESQWRQEAGILCTNQTLLAFLFLLLHGLFSKRAPHWRQNMLEAGTMCTHRNSRQTQDNRLDTHKHLFQVHVKQTQDRLHIFFQVNARGPGNKYFFLLLQEYPSVLTCNSAAYPRTSPTSWMKSNYKTQLLS